MKLERFLSTLPGFAFMDTGDVAHIADAMSVETYPDGHVFLDQDGPSRAFYLLLEGEVEVGYYGRSNHFYVLRVLGPGGFFGALSLLDGKPVMANYTARGEVKVASLPLSAFLLLYQPNSSVGCQFQHVIATHLAEDLKARHLALRDLLGRMYTG